MIKIVECEIVSILSEGSTERFIGESEDVQDKDLKFESNTYPYSFRDYK